KLQAVRKSGGGYMSRCPAHEDRSPSLSIKETSEGNVLLHCFAGCQFGDILAALNLVAADCFNGERQIPRDYQARHILHEVNSELAILTNGYGLKPSTAIALMKLRRSRQGAE